jgi:hypothetical protein
MPDPGSAAVYLDNRLPIKQPASTQGVKLPLSCSEPVCSSSGYSSMSLVSAPFWHARGMGGRAGLTPRL